MNRREAAAEFLAAQEAMQELYRFLSNPAAPDLVDLAKARGHAVISAPDHQVTYLMWSQKRGAWWGPGAFGYTPDITAAGRFTEKEAIGYTIGSACCGQRDQVSYPVAAPDNWGEVTT